VCDGSQGLWALFGLHLVPILVPAESLFNQAQHLPTLGCP
jgi:hypothetical protein